MFLRRVLAVSATSLIAASVFMAGVAAAAPETSSKESVARTAKASASESDKKSSGNESSGDKGVVIAKAAEGADDTSGEAKASETKVAATEKPAKKPVHVPTTLKASINLTTQTMVVSEHGSRSYTFKISSGTRSHPTPRGTFRPQWMARKWNSRKYDWAPMPYSVFIHGGIAIHGTTHTGRLGSPASHGCIRLSTGNARTFFNLVNKHGKRATKVTVYGTPNFRRTPVARSNRSRRRKTRQAYSNDWGFFGSGSAYEPSFTNKKKYRKVRKARRRYRIVRGPDGRKRRVYIAAQPSNSWFDW